MPDSNVSLFFAITLKLNKYFTLPPFCCFTFNKNISSINLIFLAIYYIEYEKHTLSGAGVAPTLENHIHTEFNENLSNG